MADSTTPIQQIVAAAGADVQVNENFDAASPSMLYGRRANGTVGLNWNYYGGRFSSASIANGSVTLSASTANYIVANKTTGAVSVATSTTNWDDAANYLRLYKVTTGTTAPTSYEDHRQGIGGAGGSLPVRSTTAVVMDATDTTKQLKFDVSSFSTGTTRTATMPNKSGTVAMISDIPGSGAGASDLAQDTGSTTGLTYGYLGGSIRNNNIVTVVPAGTVALTNAATNYVESDASGGVTANTVGFTSGRFPMAQVTTAGSAITVVTDKRAWISLGATGGGGNSIEATFAPPPTSGWSWVNQGTATITSTSADQVLQGGAAGSGANLRSRVRTLAASSNYTLTARIQVASVFKNFQSAGLVLRDGSGGGQVQFDVLFGNTGLVGLRVAKFTSATAFSAEYLNLPIVGAHEVWLRIRDDGTNRICFYSTDGINWLQFHSVGRTDFITPTQAGFCIGVENAVTPQFAPILRLLSWQETTP